MRKILSIAVLALLGLVNSRRHEGDHESNKNSMSKREGGPRREGPFGMKGKFLDIIENISENIGEEIAGFGQRHGGEGDHGMRGRFQHERRGREDRRRDRRRHPRDESSDSDSSDSDSDDEQTMEFRGGKPERRPHHRGQEDDEEE